MQVSPPDSCAHAHAYLHYPPTDTGVTLPAALSPLILGTHEAPANRTRAAASVLVLMKLPVTSVF